MKNKILFYCLFLIGFISIFLPFNKESAIGCGYEASIVHSYNQNLFEAYIKNLAILKLDFVNILDIIFSSLFILSIIIPVILFSYKKHIALIIINLFSLLTLLLIGFSRNFDDDLLFGYYILVSQQIVLLSLQLKIIPDNRIKTIN
jgi:hypothetical protein